MHYIYILRLKNHQFYVGHTSNLKNRFKEHQRGYNRITKRIAPEELVFYAAFKGKKKALDFEKYLKSSSGFAFRNKRLI